MFALSRKTSALSFSPAMQNIVPAITWEQNGEQATVSEANMEARVVGRYILLQIKFRFGDGESLQYEGPGQGTPGTPQHRAC